MPPQYRTVMLRSRIVRWLGLGLALIVLAQLAVAQETRPRIGLVLGADVSYQRFAVGFGHARTFASNTFVLAGFDGPGSPQTPVLVRQADLAIDRLKSPDLVLPKSLMAGIRVDPVAIAAELESEVKELRESHDKLRLARREVQKSRKEKNRVLEEHQELFQRISRAFENFYLMAGEPELAAQIRPSGHRPGRRAVEVEGEAATPPESPSEESPDTTAS